MDRHTVLEIYRWVERMLVLAWLRGFLAWHVVSSSASSEFKNLGNSWRSQEVTGQWVIQSTFVVVSTENYWSLWVFFHGKKSVARPLWRFHVLSPPQNKWQCKCNGSQWVLLAAHRQGYRVATSYNPSYGKWLGNPITLDLCAAESLFFASKSQVVSHPALCSCSFASALEMMFSSIPTDWAKSMASSKKPWNANFGGGCTTHLKNMLVKLDHLPR